MYDLSKFRGVIRNTAIRLKLQQVFERVTTTSMLAVATLLVGLYYYKTWALGLNELWAFLALAIGWLVAGVVWGLMTSTFSPPSVPSEISALNLERQGPKEWRRTISSAAMKPTLCRLDAYFEPGLPSPAMISMASSLGAFTLRRRLLLQQAFHR